MGWLEDKYLYQKYEVYGNIRVYNKLEYSIYVVIKKHNSRLILTKPYKICNMLRNKGFRFDEYDKLYDYDMVINDNKVLDTSSGYLSSQIDTQGEVETIWGVTLATDGELSTGLASQDACSEITGCVENAITSSALTDYYLKTAIDTQGELETIWGVTLLNTASTLDATKLSGNLPAIDGSALTGIAGGDSWSDAVDSNIVPDGNNTRELGSLQNQFNKMYLKYGYVDNSIEKNGYPSQGIYFGTNAMSIRLQNPTAVALNIEQGLVTINDGGVDTNFKIKGDNDANLFYTDASTDRIGIGTATPSEKLHIVGNQIITGYINSTVATGKIMDFQNGCSLQQNSTDLWFEC